MENGVIEKIGTIVNNFQYEGYSKVSGAKRHKRENSVDFLLFLHISVMTLIKIIFNKKAFCGTYVSFYMSL